MTVVTAQARLRLMASSDVHMHALPFDYRKDQPAPAYGLAALAPLIAAARAEVPNAVLVDNGDLLQGAELGNTLAASDEPCPMAQAVARMGYDAIGLGNHDFDFGWDVLERFVAASQVPVLCSNIAVPGARDHLLLRREVALEGGGTAPLTLGIASVLPPQTATWNRKHWGARPAPLPQEEAAQAQIAALRAQGADLVLLLAHTGPSPDGTQQTENAAQTLAGLPGIDAMVCGHVHKQLPGPDFAGWPGIDGPAGRIGDVPAVMPGFAGSHLGLIDLELEWNGTWSVRRAEAQLRRAAEADPDIAALFAPAHAATRARLSRQVGTTPAPMHSYFAALGLDHGQALIAAAMRQAVRAAGVTDLPILATVPPNAAGGLGGPSNYLDLPAGPVLERHVATLAPYVNAIWVLRLTGAQLLDWAEWAAQYIAAPGPAGRSLTNPIWPAFNFDGLFGLDLTLDPARPPAFAADGTRIAGAGRITRAMWQGAPLNPEASFAVAATSYRAAGGGDFPGAGEEAVIARLPGSWIDAIRTELAAGPVAATPGPWHFVRRGTDRAILRTGPGAEAHLDAIAAFAPRVVGQTPDGFLQIEVTL
ncbi:MAG: 5'-nucleotidase C-terminal domain-containing protein [Pseudomonadota bacterium]